MLKKMDRVFRIEFYLVGIFSDGMVKERMLVGSWLGDE